MDHNVIVKDSGQRQAFDTGSVRDTRDGKGRYDLLPPYAIYLVSRQFEEGATKYGSRNWEKGQPLSRYVDSALRHLFKHLGGETDERHDVAAAWNCLAMLETKHKIDTGDLPKDLDDI